jgi:hypothetical protein
MNSRIFLCTLLLGAATTAFAQDGKKVYTTTSGELIFSFADINYKGGETGSIMRFSPVVNIQNWVNIDKSDNFGFFSGLSVRNVGFIYEPPDQPGIKKKYRTYNLGIPIGIKVGNLSDKFLFAGYELEIPVNFKEKTFENEDKTKNSVWFSDQVTTFNHSLMVGAQLPYGATLKFKYYLSNFFNKDYTMSDGTKPYEGSDYNIFYFSLSFGLLKNADFYYNNE